MRTAYCVITALALAGLSDALSISSAPYAKPRRSVGLIERKKWTWDQASMESKTEWAIVLRRYFMVDMAVFELERHFGDAMPATSSSGEASNADEDACKMAQVKLTRLQSNLEKAVLDQNTSETTAEDMQKDRVTNHLTLSEKRILRVEHKREQEGFLAVEASGQDVLQKAKDLIQALTDSQKKPRSSWMSIVGRPKAKSNDTSPYAEFERSTSVAAKTPAMVHTKNSTATQKKTAVPTLAAMFQKYQEAAKSFHADLGSFQANHEKAFANFLSTSIS